MPNPSGKQLVKILAAQGVAGNAHDNAGVGVIAARADHRSAELAIIQLCIKGDLSVGDGQAPLHIPVPASNWVLQELRGRVVKTAEDPGTPVFKINVEAFDAGGVSQGEIVDPAFHMNFNNSAFVSVSTFVAGTNPANRWYYDINIKAITAATQLPADLVVQLKFKVLTDNN